MLRRFRKERFAMPKKLLAALVLLAALAVTIAAGSALAPGSAVRPIAADSPCPAAGCASGACHGFEAVPEPDGVHEMTCPEAGCTSAECHGWDSLIGRYHQASDASLNMWIIMPTVLVLALWLLVRRSGRGARGREGRGDVLTSSSAEAAPAAKVPAAHSTAEVSIARSADLADADFDFEREGA